jgi:transposase
MTPSWYGSQCDSDACNFGALAVIYPLLNRMKVDEIIEHHLPKDVRAEFGHGPILSLLIAARLFRPTALINVAEWAADSGADLLWEVPAEKINDDRLGRSLDAFFKQRHSILAHLALHVSKEFGVPLTELHYDPTHILFAGAYEGAAPREGVVGEETTRSDGDLLPAHITKGRSTDDAPHGALMIHAGLCTQVDEFGPLPLFGHTVDGNQNGRTAVAEQFALLRKHLPHVKLTMYSDRGTFSAGHLRRLTSEGFHAVCSVPWDEFRPLFDQQRKTLAWKKASFLSIEQQRRRAGGSDLPQEHYELATVRHTLVDDETKQEIPCRVIFVFSTADQKVVRKQRQKQIDKLQAGLKKIQASVAAGRRSTDAEAISRRVQKLFGTKQAARYFTFELIPLTKKQQAALPAPKRGCKRATHRFAFTFDQAALRLDETYDGYSALVTTVPQNQAGADALFTKFKEQNYSEHAHRQFKGPLAVSPVFLHSPQRVEALVFLLLIALTAYFLLQRLYRQSAPKDAPQKERRTTTQTILRAFHTYLLLVHRTRLGREIQPTRLSVQQRELLQRLGFPTPAQILSQLLPRPPT